MHNGLHTINPKGKTSEVRVIYKDIDGFDIPPKFSLKDKMRGVTSFFNSLFQ
jgi:hypothetical protein